MASAKPKRGVLETYRRWRWFRAAKSGNHSAIIRLLADGHGNAEWRDRGGRTALHHTAMRGRIRATHVLLKAGAKPDTADFSGATPIDLAERIAERPSFLNRKLPKYHKVIELMERKNI